MSASGYRVTLFVDASKARADSAGKQTPVAPATRRPGDSALRFADAALIARVCPGHLAVPTAFAKPDRTSSRC